MRYNEIEIMVKLHIYSYTYIYSYTTDGNLQELCNSVLDDYCLLKVYENNKQNLLQSFICNNSIRNAKFI